MVKIDWYYAAVRIAKIYATQWECSMYDEGDKSYCYCPICEEKLDLI